MLITQHPDTYIASRQQGVALIMALVFLLLLTILGITALSTTSLEEKMAGNMKDRNLAFQAAESALLVGENWVITQINKPVFPANSSGRYVPSTTTTPVWDSVDWSSSNVVTYGGTLSGVNKQPKYIIEDLGEVPEEGGSKVTPTKYAGKGKTILRVTARGTGGTDAAQAMVQSNFARIF